LRVDDVISLRSDALIVRGMQAGTVRASGGAYEKHFVELLVFGTDGLLTRWEFFEADRDDEALARFDELAVSIADARPSASVTTVRIENAATRALARGIAALKARDWGRFAALF